MQNENKKILIIDDDIQIGNLEQEALEQHGYTCARAYSGTEAVIRLARVEVQVRKTGTPLSAQSSAGDIVMDHVSHSVEISGKPVSLTRTEYDILKLLSQNPGQ